MRDRIGSTPWPTARERLQIALESGLAVRTVDRAYLGLRALEGTRARISHAARAIGVAPPPEHIEQLGSEPLPQLEARARR